MKLILPIEFYRQGGVERVISGTVEEWIKIDKRRGNNINFNLTKIKDIPHFE